ncbi:NAD(P)-dependent oxidoreductase [Streptomyces sp. NPDC046870]|uniref:NAD(P)-dependent oxidoreductase n=1 Tax=Streptomyces sp. NPDC046870 TaxID=3155135 RepID=UPI0034529F3C
MAESARPRALVVADDFARDHVLTEAALRRLSAVAQVTVLGDDDEGRILREVGRSTALLVAGWDTRLPYLDAERLAGAPLLRLAGAGQDGRWRFLDVREALRRGVVCSDSSGAMGPVVAEFALGLVLCCLRDIPGRHALVASGGWWDGWEDAGTGAGAGAWPTTLAGRRVGIVGMGGIGRHLVRLLSGAGCDTAVCSSWLSPAAAGDLGVELVSSVRQLARRSEILVVATQPRADTAGLVDADAIAELPAGAVVVLVGRAATVDLPALLARAAAGKLRVGLDVHPEEPLPRDHPVRGMPNVVHTPHVAGRTLEANRLIFEELVGEVERVLAGAAPRWATTAERVARVLVGRRPPQLAAPDGDLRQSAAHRATLVDQ